MPDLDQRNILHVGAPMRPGDPEITSAMADAVSARITVAGGSLPVWAVLHEDVYETRLGDGFYLHLRGAALNEADAQALAALAGDAEWVKWHVRAYRLGLKNGVPVLLKSWPKEEEFTLDEFVTVLAEIPPGGVASKLHTGTGRREDGPFVELPR
ncbi:MAG: hypothetical protein GC201_18430 [Alphaproteobacteria bacterium]|nr:hypothetical protein [Alphaproteobacteria bacterium]